MNPKPAGPFFDFAPFQNRVKPRDQEWSDRAIASLGDVTPPAGRARRVVVTGFTRFAFWAKAKVYQGDYFPAFTRRLAEHDIDTHFVWTEAQLLDLVDGPDAAILHLFNEELPWPYTPDMHEAERRSSFVFCTRRAGSIISNKAAANRYLTAQGVPMPRAMAPGEGGAAIFSNAAIGSGKRVIVTTDAAAIPEGRYNTEFIDTRIEFGGKTWYTMFRIQAVGRSVLHAYVRARDAAERAPSVHSKDTPADAALLNHLHETLVAPRQAEIAAFTDHLGSVLGPGCYAHDMVVCRDTGRMAMVESGYKFNDSPYAKYLESVKDQTPANATFYDGLYSARAADLFVAEWAKVLAGGQPAPWLVLKAG